ncbi:MAG: LptF/LptG family permease [Muribaculaceae bacterium]|nr:LptF/LptG family permease [Muribaculaceae bacterium]
MVIIKRLYSYMLQRFLPLLLMTFFICLFIVLMQALWSLIDDLVGKGLEMKVIAELFFYAALKMVPMALPLAVLLASLMVFGNLGEKFELTAMKASGISLFRIMRPLIVVMGVIGVGAFFFQDIVLPIAQTKMYTLVFSVRQKSPEVEIPVQSFYDQIPNMNLYIEDKNPDTGMLYGMILYDLSRGLDNNRVILADSGRFNFTEDKTRLYMQLYSGEMFENMRDNSMGATSSRYLPFRREHFSEKDVYFPFDANFNKLDEGGIRSQYVGQNMTELLHSIDSIGAMVDSIGLIYGREIMNTAYFGVRPTVTKQPDGTTLMTPAPTVALSEPLDLDSIFQAPNPSYAKTYVTQALAKAKRQKQEYYYRSMSLSEQAKLMRKHDIELQRKFTLSFACIIFFFIGAPLGAIIKKGGLGTPLVISVLLFIVYYLIDNMGYKMARDGKIPVWEGIWMSSFVLLPLGIFFTWKAVGDSAVFNVDAYRNFFRSLIGKGNERRLTLKEVRMEEVDVPTALAMLTDLQARIEPEVARAAKMNTLRRFTSPLADPGIASALNEIVDYISNTTDIYTINILNQYPFKPTPRNISGCADTTRALIERIGGGKQPHDDTDNGHED